MLTWSTDALPPSQRFEYWREVRGRHLGGVTMDLDRDRRAAFEGRFWARPLGAALISEIHSTAYDVSRSPVDIERLASDSLRISCLISGSGWVETPIGGFSMPRHSLNTSYSDLPFAIAQRPDEPLRVRLLRIPLATHPLLQRHARDFHTASVEPGQPHGRLLHAAFFGLADKADRLTPSEAGEALEDIAQLVLLVRGLVRARTPESARALRAALRDVALAMIDSDFASQDLSPETAAARLGISVRQLHVLFEPTGLSFARTLQARRVAAARTMLARQSGLSVADIAFAAGFDSLPTFYRAFRQLDGGRPGDYRGI